MGTDSHANEDIKRNYREGQLGSEQTGWRYQRQRQTNFKYQMVYSITRSTYKNLFEALLLIPFAHRKYCRIGFQYRIRSRIDVIGLLVLHHDNEGHARVLTNVQLLDRFASRSVLWFNFVPFNNQIVKGHLNTFKLLWLIGHATYDRSKVTGLLILKCNHGDAFLQILVFNVIQLSSSVIVNDHDNLVATSPIKPPEPTSKYG